MLRRLLLSVSFTCLSVSFACAQGSISGTVKDARSGESIVGANVVIQGTQTGATTDIDGNFTIPRLAAGTYNLHVSFITYKTHLVPNVEVEDAKKTSIEIQLSEDITELQEVVVQGTRQMDTDINLLKAIQESRLVVVGIGAEQISRSLDRDAAQVLKRVPGITIKDDQFIVSRGLAERYNPVMLHNTYAPSVETDVRSFSFATIPSSQLDRMMVYKSPAADLPGDFAGSVVKIFTKSIPEEKGWVIDYSTQFRAGTTFNDFYYQQKNPGFFTGYNTGYYNLPANFPSNVNNVHNDENLMNAGKSLKNLWKANQGTAMPDQRLTATYNAVIPSRWAQIGTINALSYSNTYATFAVRRGDYTQSDPNFEYNDQQYNRQIRTGLLSNWAFKFNERNMIEFKNLYNVSSNDQLVRRFGVEGSISGGQTNGSFDKVYRGIYSSQLMGKHDLFKDRTTIEWVAGYNNSYRDQPDYKRYQSLGGQLNVPNTVTPTALGRYFATLAENSYSGGASIRQIIPVKEDPLKSPQLKAGFYFENKQRSFHARNIGYTAATTNFDPRLANLPIDELMQPRNINNTTGIQVGEITYQKDSYSARNNLLAYYLMASVPLGSFKLDAGARVEDNKQQLNSYDDFAGHAVHFNSPVTRLLPSANLSYNFTEKMLVRAAYGQTLNRPEFRELAPFSFYDFNFNFIYYGNYTLKTARIQNVDLRWEFYPNKGEMITFGVFYKDFTDPIESYIDINSPGGGNKLVTFVNSTSAKTYGLEIEAKKSLAGLADSRLLDNLSVMVNSTVLSSTVKVPEAYATGRATSRPMQGQSPYIINAGLYYNSDNAGWQVNLLYNTAGKTLYFVGTDFYHDVYVMPRHVVDLTFTKRLSDRFNLKGGIVDILNQPIRYYNSGVVDGKLNQVIQKYKPGQVFSIGVSARL